MNLTKKYNDLSLEIYQTKMKNLGYNLNLDEENDFIYEYSKKLTTEFSFFNKSLLQKKTKFWEIKKEEESKNMNQKYNYNINNNKNDLLDNLNNKPKIKKQKTIIDEAPKSIISGTKLEKYIPKKTIIKKQTTFEEKILNLPENIGSLGNIAIITNTEDQKNNNINNNNQIEEYFEADNYDINNLPNDEEDNDEFIDNNINNYNYKEETPIKLIKKYQPKNQNNLDNNQDSTCTN